jgi:hypothetical protein
MSATLFYTIVFVVEFLIVVGISALWVYLLDKNINHE